MKRVLQATTFAFLITVGPTWAATETGADTPRTATSVIDGGATLQVEGVIGETFETDVRTALDRNPSVTRLAIRGPGGMRAQALRVAELANARRLTVRVVGRCASACALLWAASKTREMTYDAGLGLHRSGLDPSLALPDGVRAMLMARNDRQTDDVLRHAGFPERVIAAGAATPATSMSGFSPYELRTGGVPFELVDGDGRTAALDSRTGRVVHSAMAR